MRIYPDPLVAVREVERDLWEMGIMVHPQTMQDKTIAQDPEFATKEVRAYGFQINGYQYIAGDDLSVVSYVMKDPVTVDHVMRYIDTEFSDRMSAQSLNPGNAWKERPELWQEFLHYGKFSYTYSERMTPQLEGIIEELKERPDTRQGIINIHSYIAAVTNRGFKVPENVVTNFTSDWENKGGHGRIPCSMYYQMMVREAKLDLIYTMRSCDFLTHFPIDLMLALRLQSYIAGELSLQSGMFTYFTGSLHAYVKDMKKRGIF